MTLLAGISSLTACLGGPPECETEGLYQSSQAGQRIESPDGLDDLQSYKEQSIPDASPRPPRTDTGRCLEMPPQISTGG
jgi:hypothetical protein